MADIAAAAADAQAWADAATPAMYLGRHRRGDSVELGLATAVVPDAAPMAVVLDAGNNVLRAVSLPPATPDRLAYAAPVFVAGDFAIGSYTVSYHYTVLGASVVGTAGFDVVPGGDSGGAVISLGPIDRPEARAIVAQLACGRLVVGADPR